MFSDSTGMNPCHEKDLARLAALAGINITELDKHVVIRPEDDTAKFDNAVHIVYTRCVSRGVSSCKCDISLHLCLFSAAPKIYARTAGPTCTWCFSDGALQSILSPYNGQPDHNEISLDHSGRSTLAPDTHERIERALGTLSTLFYYTKDVV